jgi:hypothetical protein
MASECNSSMEMLKRVVFLAYIALYVIYLLGCVVALARPGLGPVMVAGGSFALALALRRAGYRWLDFDRLCQSFPSGCARDRVPAAVCREVEALVAEFHDPQTDWVRRTGIRHRLIELEQAQPEIIEAYQGELQAVLGGG